MKIANRTKWALAALSISACVVPVAETAEFRSRNPIAVPARLPEGARPVTQFRSVDRSVIEGTIKRLFAAYTHKPGALDDLLAESFLDRSRVLDNLTRTLPRDATLKVLGIQGAQTLNQHIESDPRADGELLVSIVSVVVRSELQFNDRIAGFARLPTTSEYVFRIEQKLK